MSALHRRRYGKNGWRNVVMKSNMNGPRGWNVIGPSVRQMEPTLSPEISYLFDDTPSRYAPPRGTII